MQNVDTVFVKNILYEIYYFYHIHGKTYKNTPTTWNAS